MGGHNTKGDRRERELVNTLTACGLAAMRCPSSGSATTRDLPDVLAAREHSVTHCPERGAHRPVADVWAIEVKATKATTAYADAAEAESLCAFAEAAGGEAYIAARFDHDTNYYLVEPAFCRPTPEGNYGVPHATAEDRARYVVDASAEEVRTVA